MRNGKSANKQGPRFNFAICLAFVLFWLVMITTYMTAGLFAKYIATGKGGDDARVITFGRLSIAENGVTGSEGQEYIFTPGVDLDKAVTVSFGGSEADTFLFVELDTTGWQRIGTRDFALKRGDAILLRWAVDDGWSYLTGEGDRHIYYTLLDSGDTLVNKPVIKDGKITVNKATQADYTALKDITLKLNVTAHVVQAGGFYISDDMTANANAAWNSLSQ